MGSIDQDENRRPLYRRRCIQGVNSARADWVLRWQMAPKDLRSPQDVTREALSGYVERVTFHSPDTGYCVLRVKCRGHRDLVTITGHVPSISAGEEIQGTGTWEIHREYGRQFKADFLQATPPSSLEGIERYLGSGLIKGIGPVFAKRLVKVFGDNVLDVIDSQPERLSDVDGIGPRRVARITSAWADQKVIREIMVFLQGHGVSTSRAVRIYKTYGVDSVRKVSENPYQLARDIRGIGFKTADAIAANLGIPKDSIVRARAGLSYALYEAVSDGHCGLPWSDLLKQAEQLLEIAPAILEEAINLEIADGNLVPDEVRDQRCVFLRRMWEGETAIAARIRTLADGKPSWPDIDVSKALGWIEGKLGVQLAPSQRDAFSTAISSKVLVITGGPGVGKTTLVNSILRVLSAKKVKVALAAPTGRAAKRLSEATGLEAKTVHRLLEFDPANGGFKRSAEMPIECDMLVLDESSMMDVLITASTLSALPDRAALLIVGDVDQLPSVGPGQVLRDLIASNAVQVVRLTEVFRQAAESQIITAAHAINTGRIPELLAPVSGVSDFYFVDADSPEDAADKIIKIVARRIPTRFGFNPISDVQVLAPMNRGSAGARSLNVSLQNAINPPAANAVSVERFGWTYRIGDKVMHTENDYEKEVYNGDLGIVTSIDQDAQEITITFDGRDVAFLFGELDQVVLAYASTIHKSQGSEYPVVVIPLMMSHYMMLRRNLIYTGVTRGRRLVVIVGQRKALALAIKTTDVNTRWSRLGKLLAT